MLHRYFYTLKEIVDVLNEYEMPYSHYDDSNVNYIIFHDMCNFSIYGVKSFFETCEHFNFMDFKDDHEITNIEILDCLCDRVVIKLRNYEANISHEEFKSKYENYFREEKEFYMHTLIQHYIEILLKYFNIKEEIKEVKLYHSFNYANFNERALKLNMLYVDVVQVPIPTFATSFIDDMNYLYNFKSLSLNSRHLNNILSKKKSKVNLYDLYTVIVPDALKSLVFRSLFLLTTFLYIRDCKDNEYFITNLFNDKDDIRKYLSNTNSIDELKEECLFYSNNNDSNMFYKGSHLAYSCIYDRYKFYSIG